MISRLFTWRTILQFRSSGGSKNNNLKNGSYSQKYADKLVRAKETFSVTIIESVIIKGNLIFACVCLCIEVLEYIKAKMRFLKKVHAYLKPIFFFFFHIYLVFIIVFCFLRLFSADFLFSLWQGHKGNWRAPLQELFSGGVPLVLTQLLFFNPHIASRSFNLTKIRF